MATAAVVVVVMGGEAGWAVICAGCVVEGEL